MTTEEFEQRLDLIAALSFIRGYAKSALNGTYGDEKRRLETIVAKTDEGLSFLEPKSPEQKAADTLRELRNQAGRSVPQYSDPAI